MLLSSLAVAGAQEPPKATVFTKQGDTVEGIFLGATAVELSMEVVGQQLKIPIAEIRYVSFVGQVESPAGVAAKPTVGSLEDAFAALDDLDEVVRSGVLPGQYSQEIAARFARVWVCLDPKRTDRDLATALTAAVAKYMNPLNAFGDSKLWEEAPGSWWVASLYVDYAKELAKNTSRHQETPEVRALAPGQPAKGRLGYGDKLVPASVDKDYVDYVADVYQLKLGAQTKLAFTISASPCAPVVLIIDGSEKKIVDKQSPIGWKKSLGPGDYQVWVACPTVGTYTLTASVQ